MYVSGRSSRVKKKSGPLWALIVGFGLQGDGRASGDGAELWPKWGKGNGGTINFMSNLTSAVSYVVRQAATSDWAFRDGAAWIDDGYNCRRRQASIGHVTRVDFELQ